MQTLADQYNHDEMFNRVFLINRLVGSIQLVFALSCLILLGGCVNYNNLSYKGKSYKSNSFSINDVGYPDLYLDFITDSTCELSYSFGLCFVDIKAKYWRDVKGDLVLYSYNKDSEISVTEFDRGENHNLTIKLGCENINYTNSKKRIT